ncbi:MAG: carboxypeptidase-like regulatory domain-containing protein [Bryobacteraceae bacterium]|nr:carboxypeptidase-like regulatory domain-containing protein [Bryobacteraceae bacterium]MCX7604615.1 carboxypeptidase-like regulatory domain-containing protein [Bryobacteraceae bacterium]
MALLLVCPAAPARAVQQPEGGLRITIVEGDEAIFNVRQRVAREAIIQVEDENRRPVAGALVTLTAPRDGASAIFSNGLNNITLTTDDAGRVVVRGIRPNSVQGRFSIRVTAVKEGLRGMTQINVTNAAVAAAAAGATAKIITFLAIVGAGAAAGAVAATRNGGGTGPAAAAPPATTITPGTPTVGPPR